MIVHNIKITIENSKLKDNFSIPKSEIITNIDIQTIDRKSHYCINDNIVNQSTIDCILNLKKQFDGNIIALNFANANFSGGGYILGGDAQEESLCRTSMLYYAIKDCTKFYNHNRFKSVPFIYSDYMIYSPNVPIIRNGNDMLLGNPIECSFITCPAVNRTFAKFFNSDKKIKSIMKHRIEKILSLAVSKNPQVIVLGAWGCGVFGNQKDVVFNLFENAINEIVPDDVKIIFAVI
ncbi:MAG: TIGR02452 family protein [Oscillospiraceae bacterium]